MSSTADLSLAFKQIHVSDNDSPLSPTTAADHGNNNNSNNNNSRNSMSGGIRHQYHGMPTYTPSITPTSLSSVGPSESASPVHSVASIAQYYDPGSKGGVMTGATTAGHGSTSSSSQQLPTYYGRRGASSVSSHMSLLSHSHSQRPYSSSPSLSLSQHSLYGRPATTTPTTHNNNNNNNSRSSAIYFPQHLLSAAAARRGSPMYDESLQERQGSAPVVAAQSYSYTHMLYRTTSPSPSMVVKTTPPHYNSTTTNNNTFSGETAVGVSLFAVEPHPHTAQSCPPSCHYHHHYNNSMATMNIKSPVDVTTPDNNNNNSNNNNNNHDDTHSVEFDESDDDEVVGMTAEGDLLFRRRDRSERDIRADVYYQGHTAVTPPLVETSAAVAAGTLPRPVPRALHIAAVTPPHPSSYSTTTTTTNSVHSDTASILSPVIELSAADITPIVKEEKNNTAADTVVDTMGAEEEATTNTVAAAATHDTIENLTNCKDEETAKKEQHESEITDTNWVTPLHPPPSVLLYGGDTTTTTQTTEAVTAPSFGPLHNTTNITPYYTTSVTTSTEEPFDYTPQYMASMLSDGASPLMYDPTAPLPLETPVAEHRETEATSPQPQRVRRVFLPPPPPPPSPTTASATHTFPIFSTTTTTTTTRGHSHRSYGRSSTSSSSDGLGGLPLFAGLLPAPLTAISQHERQQQQQLQLQELEAQLELEQEEQRYEALLRRYDDKENDPEIYQLLREMTTIEEARRCRARRAIEEGFAALSHGGGFRAASRPLHLDY